MTQPDIVRIDPEEAIGRLLAAEDEARAIVEHAEADAAREIEVARARARAITARAEARIGAARERYLARHAQQLAGLAEAQHRLATQEASEDARFARLAEAAERLALRLTSEGGDG